MYTTVTHQIYSLSMQSLQMRMVGRINQRDVYSTLRCPTMLIRRVRQTRRIDENEEFSLAPSPTPSRGLSLYRILEFMPKQIYISNH